MPKYALAGSNNSVSYNATEIANSEVRREVDRGELLSLDNTDVIKSLAERLASVLREGSPEKASEDSIKVPVCVTPLGRHLSNVSDRIMMNNEAIRSLLGRLEL